MEIIYMSSRAKNKKNKPCKMCEIQPKQYVEENLYPSEIIL